MFWAVISGVLEYGFSFLDKGCQTLSGINGPIGNRRKVGFDLEAFVQRKIQGALDGRAGQTESRSEEHTSELQSLMRISYAVFCLKKKKQKLTHPKLPIDIQYNNIQFLTYHTSS